MATDPLCSSTAPGDANTPEPIIEPTTIIKGIRDINERLRAVAETTTMYSSERGGEFSEADRAKIEALVDLQVATTFGGPSPVAAELVFGVSSGQGGLGWFIFENRNLLDIPAVFAGLLTVIIIGLFVENLIFRAIERNTVQKWGTQS